MKQRQFPPRKPKAPPANETAESTSKPGHAAPRRGLLRPALTGVTASLLLIVALGGWATTTELGGAVIARGTVQVEGDAKVVQHADGGIVETIAVENGALVTAGQILMVLDSDIVAADLAISRARLAAALALRARLDAEQTSAPEIVFSYPALPTAVTAPPGLDLPPQEARQRAIFVARAELLTGTRARLVETQAQIEAQIAGTEAQIDALATQISSLDEEISVKESLVDDGLSRRSQLNELVRSRANLVGQQAALVSEITALRNRAREAEIATEQDAREFQEKVATELREVTSEIEELILTIVTRQGQLDRMEVRAPAAGVVHELALTTEGGVLAPGDTVMQIIPQDGGLRFEVEVDPASIDQVYPGQAAELIFSAFDQDDTPKLQGEVHHISPAAVTDPQTDRSFYRVDLSVSPEELARLESAVLVPGMPVEAFLHTDTRSVMAYLVKPITSHARRAFRE